MCWQLLGNREVGWPYQVVNLALKYARYEIVTTGQAHQN
jgi:hypothetical protein